MHLKNKKHQFWEKNRNFREKAKPIEKDTCKSNVGKNPANNPPPEVEHED